jgi:hypothetical protein
MPIRFRCAYCNQLMAISRRKIGTVVRCPKCAGDIIVPAPDGTQPAEDPQAPTNLAFDDPNFDAELIDPPSPNLTVQAGSAKSPRPATEPMPSTAPPPAAPSRRGLFIPLGVLLISAALILLLLILSFVLGILVGRPHEAT